MSDSVSGFWQNFRGGAAGGGQMPQQQRGFYSANTDMDPSGGGLANPGSAASQQMFGPQGAGGMQPVGGSQLQALLQRLQQQRQGMMPQLGAGVQNPAMRPGLLGL